VGGAEFDPLPGVGVTLEVGEVGVVEEGYSWVIERSRIAIACSISVLLGKSFPRSFVTMSCKNEKSVSTAYNLLTFFRR